MGKYQPKEKTLRKCLMCRTAFGTALDHQKFCTRACRVRFHTLVNEMGQCPHCGKDLLRNE